jgi:3'(2'), 5'-bisphosphate nucleotidase
LLAIRGASVLWGDPGAFKATGDAAAHNLITARLAELRPDDAVLSEEGKDDSARLAARRVWIVDPLDGTREFSEPPRDDWAVHVALVEDGELVAGAVARPAMGSTLATDEVTIRPRGVSKPLRIAVSRSRPPEFVHALAQRLDAELVPMGSAGIKATAVLDDRVDAYVHAGGQYEWDSAAPVAVAQAAGLHTSRLDGSPLRYNQADPLLPDLLVCRPEIAELLLKAVAEISSQEVTV